MRNAIDPCLTSLFRRSWLLSSLVFVIGSLAAINNHPNIDEVAHLPAGVSHLRFGTFDLYRVNPPLARSVYAIPAWIQGDAFDWELYSDQVGLRPEFTIGKAKLSQVGVSYADYFRGPRVFAASLCFLFLFWLYRNLVLSVLGQTAFSVALLFALADPNILCQAGTIGPDLSCACMCSLVSLATWQCCKARTTSNVLILGMLVGVAMLTKLTLCILIVLVPILYLSGLVYLKSRVFPALLCLDIGLLLSTPLIVINFVYLFEGSFTALGEFQFCSKMLGGDGLSVGSCGNSFRSTMVANIPVPLPKNYLLGIDYLRFEVERGYWSFLNGTWRFGSWPHYYILTTLYKTPEPTLLALAVSSILFAFACWKNFVTRELKLLVLLIAIPALACFVAISVQGGFNHHHRYVLMIYPPIFFMISFLGSRQCARWLLRSLQLRRDRRFRRLIAHSPLVLVTCLGILSAVSAIRVHPHYTSYFNSTCGGPGNGWKLLGFSNIDWGQDILELDQWLKSHPDCRPLVMDIDYFGMNGELFGISTNAPPQLSKKATIADVQKTITETQWWIISVKKLYNRPGFDGLEYLQQVEPVEKIAYAYHVYRIDPVSPDPKEN